MGDLSKLLAEIESPDRLRERLALKSLLVPEGVATTYKVLVFAKHAPALSSAR